MRWGIRNDLFFAPLYLLFDSLPDQVRTLLAVLQGRIYPLKRPLGEARGGLFMIDLFSTHALNIVDITYCYKRENTRYLLLTNLE